MILPIAYCGIRDNDASTNRFFYIKRTIEGRINSKDSLCPKEKEYKPEPQ